MLNRCKSEIRQWKMRKQTTILDLARKNRNVLFKYRNHRRRNKPSAFSLRDRNGEPTSDPIVVSEFYRDHYADCRQLDKIKDLRAIARVGWCRRIRNEAVRKRVLGGATDCRQLDKIKDLRAIARVGWCRRIRNEAVRKRVLGGATESMRVGMDDFYLGSDSSVNIHIQLKRDHCGITTEQVGIILCRIIAQIKGSEKRTWKPHEKIDRHQGKDSVNSFGSWDTPTQTSTPKASKVGTAVDVQQMHK
ncbi:hypothetical protein CLF_112948, partial [Clonorchis sinensis]